MEKFRQLEGPAMPGDFFHVKIIIMSRKLCFALEIFKQGLNVPGKVC